MQMSKTTLPTETAPNREDEPSLSAHSLEIVTTWLPGPEPTDIEGTLGEAHEHRTRFWRCRNCGQERNHRDQFETECDGSPPAPLFDAGYSIEEPRTRRALTENMVVRYAETDSLYLVESESGNLYDVDIQRATCTCPDEQRRGQRCKHLRRVDLEIRTGLVPSPDGTFVR